MRPELRKEGQVPRALQLPAPRVQLPPRIMSSSRTEEEVQAAVAMLGFTVDEQNLKQIMTEMDPDGDGEVRRFCAGKADEMGIEDALAYR